MRIVVWNMRRATRNATLPWDYFLELAPDLALLQEVSSIPDRVLSGYETVHRFACGKTGRPQRFGTAVLVRGAIEEEIRLSSEWDWLNGEFERFRGNLMAVRVRAVSRQVVYEGC